MRYRERKIKPKRQGYLKKYTDFVFKKSSQSCSIDKHSWLCRERKAILFPLYFLLKTFYFIKNIFLIIRLGYFELLYFAHLRVRFLHDTVYQKNTAYKKVNDYKYTRTIRRATITGFIVSFFIFQFMGSLWPEIFNPVHPKVAEGANASVTWTDQAHFEGSTPPSGAASGTTTRSNVDTSGSPGDVKLSAISNFGDGSDGALPTTGSLNSSFNINTQTNGYGGRTLADGGTATLTSSGGVGASTIYLSLSAFTGGNGIATGDEILIAKFWKVGDTTTGVYEIKTVSNGSLTTLTLSSPLENAYPSGTLVQRIPNYSSMDIGATGTVTASAWDGSTGGVVIFRVQGTLTIASGGKIDTTGLGYRNRADNLTGEGPGGGGGGSCEADCGGGGGGGYGGAGGLGGSDGYVAGSAGPAYATFPDFGSAGGTSYGSGGKGGGLIFAVINSLNNLGDIKSNGDNGTVDGGGGGSGGGIYLSVGSTVALGTVSANGGTGGNGLTNSGSGGGGGGGLIRFVSGSDPGVAGFSASGGNGGTGGYQNGQNGNATSPIYTYLAPTYNTSGTISGFKIDAGEGQKAKWSSVSWTGNEPANTDLKFRTRGADTESGLSGASWSSYYTISGSSITTTASRWLEVETTLISDGSATPTLNDFTVSYDTLESPNNSNITLSKTDGTSLKNSSGTTVGAGIAGAWVNETSVRVTAAGLTCTGCGASTNIRPEVEIKEVGTAFDETLTYTAMGSSSYVDVTLPGTPSSGQGYHLRVRAVDDEGRVSAWTSYGGNSDPNDADILYDNTNPSQAGNPSGTSPTNDTTPVWNWTASTDANSGISYYKVYWDTVAGGTANFESSATNSYTHSVALVNGTWYAKVEAYDNAGNVATISGNGSIVVDATSPDMGGITALISSGGASISTATWQTDNDPYFSWSAPGDTSGIAGYYYALDDATPESGGTWTASTSVQYGDNTISDGVHTLYVRAKDNAGNEAGTLGTFVIWIDSTVPSLSLDPSFTFSATDTNPDDITLSWGAYSDSGSSVVNYALERIKYSEYTAGSHNLTSNWSSESSYLGLGNKTGNSDIESVPGEIESSVRYVYRIKVNDSAGNSSAWLISDIGMTTDTVNPSSPSSVTATTCDGTGPNCSEVANKGYEVKLSWTPSSDSGSGVTGYKIYRKAETNSTAANDFTLVGYLDVNPPGLGGHATIYYDNDTNNDATSADTTYDPDSGTGGIQNIKTLSSNRLNDYTDYHYRITALDESGNETDVITTDGLGIPTYANYDADKTKDVTAPSTPQNVVATPMGLDSSGLAQRVDLSWNTSTDTRTSGRVPAGSGSGIAGYKILKCEGDSATCSNDGNYSQIGTSSSATYTEEGLGEFTRYFYKVIAVDSASSANIGDASNNNSARSTSATVMTASNTVPTVPLSVTVTTKTGNPNTDSGVGHQNTITFNGSYAKNCSGGIRCITGYEIYRSIDNFATNNTLIANVSLSAVGDERGVTYTYVDNNSTNDSTAPSITRSSGGGPIATKAQTARLSDATTYYYKVKAKDNTPANPDGGPFASGLSAVTTGTLHTGWDTTADDTAPNTPASVAVKNIHPNNSMVRNIITWTMISDSTRNGTSDFSKYQVYRYETLLGVGTASLISEKTDRGDNYHVDGIVNTEKDKDYSYYVIAMDNAGTDFKYANNQVINSTSNMSGYESPVSINPGSVNPTVSNIQVPSGNVGVSSAVVTWTTNQNTDSLVEYRVKGTNDVVAAGKDRTQPTMNHSVTLGNLSKGTQYQYRVISRNSLGNIDEDDASNWREFTTNNFSISDVAVDTTTGTATVKWNTNIASDSYVEYKLEGSSDKSKIAGDSTLTAGHEVSITGLSPSKRYTYKIRSVTSDKYIAETAFQTFITKDNDLNQFVTVPAETNVSEKNVTATTAKITWVTAVATTSWVEYGTTQGLYSMSAGNNDFNTSHSVELQNLTPGTKYYYRVKGKTETDIEYFSPESSFTAVLLPEISNLRVREFSSYQATITFDTNVDAVAAISYGKDEGYGQRMSKAKAEKNHVMTLEGLEDNSTYHFQVSAVDQFKNEAKSSDTAFSTPLDTKGPEITDLKVDVLPISESSETASVIISWTTDKPSTTQVEYDDKGAGDKYENHSTEDTSLNTSHTVLVKDLNTSSNYRFRIIAKDKRGNLTKTKSSSFITPTKEKSLLQIIIKSLEDTFSWTKNVPSFLGRIGNRLLGK
ncbi:hypothetical protein C4544_05525 [candidate division WS5 bacterium]|uniref:Fibronectin type-III domain-containing protein n=1 Tax=candidate division WS5 bacterium TaxID=2093353 RepID=A0A419DAS2_9BACT|nr:MAG: hypothetical protein C4544_05525 [candidate division WS5 bacterium]